MESILRICNDHGNELCHIFRSEKVHRAGFFMVHKHTSLELSLITGGNGRYSTPSGDHPIKAGDVFLYRPNEQHCITHADNLSLFNLHFSPRFFATGDATGGRFLTVFGRGIKKCFNRLPHDSDAAKHTGTLMSLIRAEAEAQKEEHVPMIRALLTEALIALYRESDVAPDTAGLGSGFEKANLAADYIDAHFTERLTLDEIASHVHLTRTYFSTLFRTYYGMAPWEYINIRRTELAKRLLCEDDENVLSIALRCGFNNTANFNRIFKAVTATTPREYRKVKKTESPV